MSLVEIAVAVLLAYWIYFALAALVLVVTGLILYVIIDSVPAKKAPLVQAGFVEYNPQTGETWPASDPANRVRL